MKQILNHINRLIDKFAKLCDEHLILFTIVPILVFMLVGLIINDYFIVVVCFLFGIVMIKYIQKDPLIVYLLKDI